MKRSCHSTRASVLRGNRVDGVAGDDEACVRDLRQRLEQHVEPLVIADQAEEEERPALGRRQLLALEDRVRDPRDPLAPEAELDQLLDGAVRVDDHALGGLEHVGPDGLRAAAARQDVVGGQDERAVVGDASQPAQVELGARQPLDVDDVRVDPLDPAHEARDARRVLEALGGEAERRAAEDARRDRREQLLAAVVVRLGRAAVREARGEERDVVALLAERLRQRVVVGRRVRERVDEDDAHQTRERR